MPFFKKFIFIFIFLLSYANSSLAQENSFVGRVYDSIGNEPLPYVMVVLQSKYTDKVIVGTTSDENGEFFLKSDSINAILKLSFMGYEKKVISSFQSEDGIIELGKIQLVSLTQNLGEVKVTAEKSGMEFKLDKRVFTVGKDISSTGMGALEVLNNVPSVTVDIEGNIKLRGNSGVQILINGKPSVLSDDPSKALGTITADMIESVEVITNPSAKYDASGTSGILNIVLKKEETKGFNGSLSVNTGLPYNHSVGGSINYRTKKFNLFTQFGAGYRSLPDYDRSKNVNYLDNNSVITDGTGFRNENFYNITLGTDYYLNERNTLTLSGNFAYEVEKQPSTTDVYLYDAMNSLVGQYQRTEVTSALNPKYQYDFQYKKQFKDNSDHTLQLSAIGRYFGKDQNSSFDNNYSLGETTYGDQKTKTNFYQLDQTYQLDYVNPFRKNLTFESGAMYNVNDVGNDYMVSNLVDGIYEVDSSLTNNFKFIQKVFGVYATGSYERSKWGIKAGLRFENTELNTLLTNTNQDNNQNYSNFFPTFHTSYKVSKAVQLQAGYSKRIFRPRLWDLNPFFNIRNNYSIRTGNPNLMPEFADSYELLGIFFIKKLTLNASAYYLYTTNVKENISYSENNITITRPENIGTNQKIGAEFNWKYSTNKWLTLNGDFNYGQFYRKGQFEDQNFDFNGNQYSTKLMAKLKLIKDFDIELSGNYESSYKTVQGVVSGFASMDAGVRKKVWKGKGVVNLSVRDIFASRIRESTIDQSTYYLYNFSKRGRFITLGFSYSFGKGEAMSYTGGGRY